MWFVLAPLFWGIWGVLVVAVALLALIHYRLCPRDRKDGEDQ